jgi:hypothetical protein
MPGVYKVNKRKITFRFPGRLHAAFVEQRFCDDLEGSDRMQNGPLPS